MVMTSEHVEGLKLPRLRHLNLSENDSSPFDVSYFLFYNLSQKPPALEELDSPILRRLTDLSEAAEEPRRTSGTCALLRATEENSAAELRDKPTTAHGLWQRILER